MRSSGRSATAITTWQSEPSVLGFHLERVRAECNERIEQERKFDTIYLEDPTSWHETDSDTKTILRGFILSGAMPCQVVPKTPEKH